MEITLIERQFENRQKGAAKLSQYRLKNYVNGVTLNVRDKEALKSFYEDLLGFNVMNETYTSIQYEVGDSGHRITLRQLDHGREPLVSEAGLFHIGIRLGSHSELADLMAHLTENNIVLNGAEHDVNTSLYFSDPEGNGFEFYADAPEETWEFDKENRVIMDTRHLYASKLMNLRSQQGWQGMPSDSQIGNVHLKTVRLSEVKDYYLKHFGLEESSYVNKTSLFMSTGGYHHNLAVNHWMSSMQRMESDDTYGLALVDYHYPATTHKWLKGPDGIEFRFNYLGV